MLRVLAKSFALKNISTASVSIGWTIFTSVGKCLYLVYRPATHGDKRVSMDIWQPYVNVDDFCKSSRKV